MTMTTTTKPAINGSPVRCTYRVQRESTDPVRLYVTLDGRIWLGYGDSPSRFAHVGNVGDNGTTGTGRDAICRAANCY